MAEGHKATSARIKDLERYEGLLVRLQGWLYNKRSSGKVLFLILRDGTGIVQGVVTSKNVGQDTLRSIDALNYESSLIVEGFVRADARAPGGYEIDICSLDVVSEAASDYPVSHKEHGPDFLLDNRHLWLRTPRQSAILAVRAQVMKACRDYLDDEGFVEVTAPILTPNACEGTSTLFSTKYFGETAYLSQSGQLYNEAAIMALEKVYCFGPTFRAEKSKTRRHLTEFWMVEPEAAFMDFEGLLRLEEDMVSYVLKRTVERCEKELLLVGRDPAEFRDVKAPFPRISYDDAVLALAERGMKMDWGDDFGAPQETAIASMFELPCFVTGYPTKIKAFYMEPHPERPEIVLAADLLAPEGYGEIIGGSQRIHDYDLIKQRIIESDLPLEEYGWYLDGRKYGSVPHSGFGLGIERLVAWICRLDHLREASPFPRTIARLRP